MRICPLHVTLSLQVHNSWRNGDVNGAQRSSKIAGRLNIAAVVTGIAIPSTFGIFAVVWYAIGYAITRADS